jgi:hypothetical protein
MTSAYSEMEAARVGEDAVLNGLSGLAGSAACLYSFAANEPDFERVQADPCGPGLPGPVKG